MRNNGKYGYIDKNGEIVIAFQYDDVRPFENGVAAVKTGKSYYAGWEYIDKNGNKVTRVGEQYAAMQDFSEGLAAVKRAGKWGYIDSTGNLVIDIKYKDAGKFSEGLAVIKVDYKCGFIDRNGNVVIEPQFDVAWGFWGGLAWVRIGERAMYIDKTGKVIREWKED